MSNTEFDSLMALGSNLAKQLKNDHSLLNTVEVVNDFMNNLVCVKIRFKSPLSKSYLSIPIPADSLVSLKTEANFISKLNTEIYKYVSTLLGNNNHNNSFKYAWSAPSPSGQNLIYKPYSDYPNKIKSNFIIKDTYTEKLEPLESKFDPTTISKYIPGLIELVKNPVDEKVDTVQNITMTLNDIQGWTREQIADWLESLDVDLQFKTEEDTNE